ncbi:hypothetical protein IW261DRAFT_1566343 [Armillaria novae-zelandiae]|uniref:Uncharacterized protein n=1 Tax=Armillaria novae-zelandiae TaxID=153914 RepID=A0AA39P4J2_9AGAR|nr:hypothetical protein IW261DRAFT_1566343 [Armillaria novae-zelandiae]
MHKTPYVFPIIAGPNLEANVKVLDISLSEEEMEYLESSVPFPDDDGCEADGSGYGFLLAWVAKLAKQPIAR